MGKFKDELNGTIMYEFVGLRPKLYSYIPFKWLFVDELIKDPKNPEKIIINPKKLKLEKRKAKGWIKLL